MNMAGYGMMKVLQTTNRTCWTSPKKQPLLTAQSKFYS